MTNGGYARQFPVAAPAPTVADSLDRVVDATQNLVGDQIDLLRAELTSGFRSTARVGAMLVSGAVLVTLSWVALLMAGYAAVVPLLRPELALVLLGAINLVPGLGLLLAARSVQRGARSHGER